MLHTIAMAKSIPCIEFNRSQDAIWVAEALSAQIEHLRDSLDHKSLFSAAFNRKYARKIEVLDFVRERCLEASRELLHNENEVVNGQKETVCST